MASSLPAKHRQHRIVPQFVVIVQVLITQRDAGDPLRHQRGNLVFNQLHCPRVAEACREAFGQPDRSVGLSQQQCSRIRGDRSAIKCGYHRPSFNWCKFE